MKVKCYGPRGSIPSPSTETFSTAKYGGDTSCYFVEAGPFRIIPDCGSGIRQLGNDLMAAGKGVGQQFIVLLSHYHWDHIQGLPFFVPVFIKANTFYFHGFVPSNHEHGVRPVVEQMLQHQQSNPHFPVAHGALASKRYYHDHARQSIEKVAYAYDQATGLISEVPATTEPAWDVVHITTVPLNHPDGCLGYLIEHLGNSLIYASDNEPLRKPNANLVKVATGAQLAVFDGQYTEEQLAGAVQTYGHGSPEACIDQAIACQIMDLKIHHFDPNNSDVVLDAMEAKARTYAEKVGYTGKIEFCRQGAVWTLGE